MKKKLKSRKKITKKKIVRRKVRKVRRNSALERDVRKVPFLEMKNGMLYGIISSGSDEDRVYGAYIDNKGNYYCSTNNNRPCGGMRGSPCKHMESLLDEALKVYSPEKIDKYLDLNIKHPEEIKSGKEFFPYFKMGPKTIEMGWIFSRYLNYLKYIDSEPYTGPIPEMFYFK